MRRDWRRRALGTWTAAVAILLAAPTLIVVPMSFSTSSLLEFPPPGLGTSWYSSFFDDPMWTSATLTSLKVALLTALLATLLGTLTAFGLLRGRLLGRGLLAAIVLSPAIVPVVVFAIGTYGVMSAWHLTGTTWGLVLPHTALALPIVVVTVGTSIRTLDPALERAASSLGASPLVTFRRVTLPLILPGVAAGALFAFVTSWDEAVVAIFMTSSLFRTLPVVIWTQTRFELTPTIAAAAAMLLALTTFAFVLAVFAQSRAMRRTRA